MTEIEVLYEKVGSLLKGHLQETVIRVAMMLIVDILTKYDRTEALTNLDNIATCIKDCINRKHLN